MARFGRGGSRGKVSTYNLILVGGLCLAILFGAVTYVLAVEARRSKDHEQRRVGLYVGSGVAAVAAIATVVLTLTIGRQWAEQIDHRAKKLKTVPDDEKKAGRNM